MPPKNVEDIIFEECLGKETTREEFQQAVYKFRKQNLDLFEGKYLFDTNGQTPYSRGLDRLFGAWVLSGVLVSSSITNNRYKKA